MLFLITRVSRGTASLPRRSAAVSGGAIGGGVEYAFTNNITAKVEYLYLPLSSTTYFGSTIWSVRAPDDVSLLRAGLNYKF